MHEAVSPPQSQGKGCNQATENDELLRLLRSRQRRLEAMIAGEWDRGLSIELDLLTALQERLSPITKVGHEQDG